MFYLRSARDDIHESILKIVYVCLNRTFLIATILDLGTGDQDKNSGMSFPKHFLNQNKALSGPVTEQRLLFCTIFEGLLRFAIV